MSSTITGRSVAAGFVGGLLGTVVMDLFGFGLFAVTGVQGVNPFAIIGDTAAGFFALLGIRVAGGVPAGAVVHYLLGPVLGVLFAAAASRLEVLRLDSIPKGAGLGVLYIEVVSLPILALAPIILRMTLLDTALWFGLSFVMHAVYGAVLGIAVAYGLRPAPAVRRA